MAADGAAGYTIFGYTYGGLKQTNKINDGSGRSALCSLKMLNLHAAHSLGSAEKISRVHETPKSECTACSVSVDVF